MTAAPAAGAARHYPLLDAGRGIAALGVLAHHVGNETGTHLAAHGYLAVDYFLMLSGFVIALAYEPRLAAGLTLAGFARLRVIRIWPMVILGGLVSLVALALRPDPDIRPAWLVGQFFLIPAFAAWVIFPANGPLWSLFYELVANLAHALLLRRWRTGLLAALLVPLAAAIGWMLANEPGYNLGFRPDEWSFALVRVFAGYLVGIVLCRLLRAGRLPAWRAGAAAPLLLVALPFAAPAALPEPLVVVAALGVCFPLAMLLGIGGGGTPGALARWLGGISFPLYAIHMPVIWIGQALGAGGPLGWAAVAAAAVAGASAAERWIDAPLRAFFRRVAAPVRL